MNMVPPELSQEVLLEKEHNESLSKLIFVRHLVQCIVEVAKTRDTPIRFANGERERNFLGEAGIGDALQRFNVTSLSQKSVWKGRLDGWMDFIGVCHFADGRKSWCCTGRVFKYCRQR